MKRFSCFLVAAGFAALVLLGMAARAEVSGESSAPLMVTLDKSEIVRLSHDIGSIILGNPLPASVLMDTSQTLIVVPKATGTTHVTVLGKDGLVLMDRHIIVDAPKPHYVRVKTTCIGKEKNCTPNRSFYCPEGRCAEIVVPEPSDSSGSASSDTEKAAMDAAVGELPPSTDGAETETNGN